MKPCEFCSGDNMQSTREVAYKLWQIRSIHGVQTSSDADWYDAERILKKIQEENLDDSKVDVEISSSIPPTDR
jgi:hypothetical protein